MAEWADVVNNVVTLAKEPKKFLLFSVGVVVFVGLVIWGAESYHAMQRSQLGQPAVQQRINGNRNQGTGTNSGTMNQTNQ